MVTNAIGPRSRENYKRGKDVLPVPHERVITVFDDKDNLIGLVLLGLCAAAGGVLVWSIVTGSELEYSGPGWLVWVLALVFFGGVIYGMVKGFSGRLRSGGSPQWPDPGSGHRPWWKFWGR